MRGKSRARIKAITASGWELLEEGREPDGKYRLEVRDPVGDRVIFRAVSRPRCFLQAFQVIERGKRLLA